MKRILLACALVCALSTAALAQTGGDTHEGGDLKSASFIVVVVAGVPIIIYLPR